jgi:hypothetical protein
MKEFDPERVTLPNQEWFIESKGDNRIKCICLPHARLPELGQGFVQFQGVSLEPLVKEEPEELLAKLRLLFEKVLVQSLAYLELLAEEEVDLPLLWLGFLLSQQGIEPLRDWKPLTGLRDSSLVKMVPLFEQEVIGSLRKMKSLPGQMVQLLVDVHTEDQGYPQDDSPVFLLRMSN